MDLLGKNNVIHEKYGVSALLKLPEINLKEKLYLKLFVVKITIV